MFDNKPSFLLGSKVLYDPFLKTWFKDEGIFGQPMFDYLPSFLLGSKVFCDPFLKRDF